MGRNTQIRINKETSRKKNKKGVKNKMYLKRIVEVKFVENAISFNIAKTLNG